jgi:hypothetical protein
MSPRGGFREGAGRKAMPEDEVKGIRRLYRFTKQELESMENAIKLSGEIEAEFVRGAIFDKVTKVFKKFEQRKKKK